MTKYVFIDNRMRDIEKQYIKNLGYILIEVPKNKELYPEISSHVDIFCTKINDSLFLEPNVYKNIMEKGLNIKDIVCGKSILKSAYPYDIAYNVCQIGNNVIHNFKYTDKKILEYINKAGLNKININQGYSNCSIAVISEDSAIVTDKKIAERLKLANIDVLCIDNDIDIKLLNEHSKYSSMKGLIGGCMCRIENKIIFFGSLDNVKERESIRSFIKKKNLQLVEFKAMDLIDYGGAISIII